MASEKLVPMPLLGTDRRRRARLKLAYEIRLNHLGNLKGYKSVTNNISADGFFCTVRYAPKLRDILVCELVIPASGRHGSSAREFILHYRAEVVRVVSEPDGHSHGVACRLMC